MRLKRHVSGYFRRRNLRLRSLKDKGLSRADDFFELYVLACLLKNLTGAVPENLWPGRTFKVALSPSSNWNEASWFRCTGTGSTYGLRTGLEVSAKMDPGTVELDVLFVDLTNPVGPGVLGTSVDAAFECKAHRRSIDQTKANEVIGKSYRVWGQLPVPLCPGARGVQRYGVLSFSPATPFALNALSSVAIAFVEISSSAFPIHLRKVLNSLGLVVRSPKRMRAATHP